MRRTLNEQVVAALLGGAGLLLAEIRFEHRQVLGETRLAWIPLVYAGLLLLAGSLALWRWNAGGRRVLAALFALAIVVGALGLWFHSGGHPLSQLGRVAAAFLLEPGKDGGLKIGSQPPALAPGAFLGIGALGLLACWKESRPASAME